jgi:predicted dehydrogenase
VTPRKILFVGLGGAGQRHLRIFKSLLAPQTVFTAFRSTRHTPLLNADFSVNEKDGVENHYGLKTFGDLEAALDDGPDLVVISTPSALHLDAAQSAAERGIGVFVEKPFSHNLAGFETFRNKVLTKDIVFFISFQRRFHSLIRKAQHIIADGKLGDIFSAVFNVASYVPAWHGYEDFRKLYACRKDLGGGVLLTEIHELDLCHWFFGSPRAVSCTGGTLGGVEMDVEDTAHVTLDYPGLAVNVNLCFMQKHNRRDFFVAGTKGHLEWNQDGNTLAFEDYASGKTEICTEPDAANDDMFVAQAEYFLNAVTSKNSPDQLENARASLALVEVAKQSMISGGSVPLSSLV